MNLRSTQSIYLRHGAPHLEEQTQYVGRFLEDLRLGRTK